MNALRFALVTIAAITTYLVTPFGVWSTYGRWTP